MNRFLLDTGMILGFVREAVWADRARYELILQNGFIYTSVICQGEILALSKRLQWGRKKRTKLEQILNRIPIHKISDPSIVDAYARISTWTKGMPLDGFEADPPKPAITMGQNDLWIAATAHASNTTLVSTDTDFRHLDGVWLKLFYVDQRP